MGANPAHRRRPVLDEGGITHLGDEPVIRDRNDKAARRKGTANKAIAVLGPRPPRSAIEEDDDRPRRPTRGAARRIDIDHPAAPGGIGRIVNHTRHTLVSGHDGVEHDQPRTARGEQQHEQRHRLARRRSGCGPGQGLRKRSVRQLPIASSTGNSDNAARLAEDPVAPCQNASAAMIAATISKGTILAIGGISSPCTPRR